MNDEDAQSALPELAGMAEVASILGVSRQRVRELATRDDFPSPVAQLSGGTVYMKWMIEAFSSYWTRKPGRPGRLQDQVSAELAHMPKDPRDLIQQILRMIYNNTRLHDLKLDASTPRGQSLYHAISMAKQHQPTFKPSYDATFFEIEPPDQRYIKLHADCCPGLGAIGE
jgi:hypothetical protein